MQTFPLRTTLLLSVIVLAVTQGSGGQALPGGPRDEKPHRPQAIPKSVRDRFERNAIELLDDAQKLVPDAHIMIYNGRRVRPGEAPWVVAFVDSDRRSQAVCGGALVAPSWILTAEHCGIRPSEDLAVIGQPELTSHSSVTSLNLACAGPKGSDLALVRLATASASVPLAAEASPDSNQLAGQEMRIFGWGMTEEGSASKHLLKADVPIISRETCQAQYPTDAVCATCFCAWDQRGITDACQFDSGGPGILSKVAADGPTQVGVIREGAGCGQKPGIYSFVPGRQAWISHVIRTVEASGACPEVTQ